MVFNLQFHWSIRFALNLTVLVGPIFAFWTYPFLFRTSTLYKRQDERVKSYDQVRMKPWNEIQIMTPEAEAVKQKIETEGAPTPLYSRILSDKELAAKGLYSVGRN